MTEREVVLSLWLGELLYQKKHTHDWMALESVNEKINALYLLLDVDAREDGFANKMKKCIEILNG